jgi:hypothetical protein
MPWTTGRVLGRDWQRGRRCAAIPTRRRFRIESVVSSALSDEALLPGLAAGDADAATAFTRRFQARVYGLVLTIVRDEATAEDVAQETFVRAWRHARAYDPRRGSVATRLLTIARNHRCHPGKEGRAARSRSRGHQAAARGRGGQPRRRGFATGRARARTRRHRRAAVGTATGPVSRRLPRANGIGDREAGGNPARNREDAHPGGDAQAARFTWEQE